MKLGGVLLDLDGVVYVGEQAVPGAVEALDWLRSEGIAHRFVTNTSSRPRQSLCDKLSAFGIDTPPAQIISPPVVAAQWLSEHADGGPAALFVPRATEAEFAAVPVWDGDTSRAVASVVLGDLGLAWDFARLNLAFELLMQTGAPTLLALGMTRYWRATDGLRLDTGPFVAALEYATGRQAIVTGKPEKTFFLSGAEALGVRPTELLMVGDDICADIDGARQAGLKTMQVRSGKFQPSDLRRGIKPDAVVDSLADLPRWWREHVQN